MTRTAALSVPTRGPVTSVAALARGAKIGIALALVANIVVFLLGNLGAPIRVVTGWDPDGADLRIAEVIVTTIAFVVVAAAALWLLERLTTNGFRIWTAGAVLVAVASIVPLLGLDVDAGSKIALSAMHLVVGASVIAGQAAARLRR